MILSAALPYAYKTDRKKQILTGRSIEYRVYCFQKQSKGV